MFAIKSDELTHAQRSAVAAFQATQGVKLTLGPVATRAGWKQVDATVERLSFETGPPAPGAIWAGTWEDQKGRAHVFVQFDACKLILTITESSPSDPGHELSR